MAKVKAVQLAVNSLLPPELQDINRSYNKKSVNELMSNLYRLYPDKYAEIIDKISDIARDAVYYNGESIRLSDFKPVFDKTPVLKELDKQIALIKSTIKDSKKQKEALTKTRANYATMLEKMTNEYGAKTDNSFVRSTQSGARGNSTQLNALINTPSLYTDLRGDIIPMFIRHGYNEGLSPAEYLASTFGSRASTITIKRMTGLAGFFGKSLNRAVSNLIVTRLKDSSNNGIDLSINDPSLYGRVLARDTFGLVKGTPLDKDAINFLKKRNVDTVLVHSPIATISEEGIPAEAFGLDYTLKLPKIGSSIGLTASTAIAEPVTQGSLCLEENTLVRMGDNSVKAIKDINIGEYVLGSDKKGNTFPVKVLSKFDQGLKDVNRYYLKKEMSSEDIISVDCTKDHKFLLGGKVSPCNTEVPNYDLQILPIGSVSDLSFYTPQASRLDIKYRRVASENIGLKHCYDIEVDHPDHLFVLANNLITSNSSKHTSGAFKGLKKDISGFNFINQFVQSPDIFPDRAAVALESGKVSEVKDAPQGGKYITINDIDHYVYPDTEIYVKKGDGVEAGSIMSDGLADVEDIIHTRGLGEGRRYFSERLKQILDDSGTSANLRNTEVLARGFIDKVEVTNPEGLGSHLPGDIISYNYLEANYVPEEDSKEMNAKDAVGKYLQRPILHYTIGTKILPSMAERINKNKMGNVLVSSKEPGFKPVMVRLVEAPMKGTDDWIAKNVASYQKKNLINSAIRGEVSNVSSNINPFVRMSQPDFAENVEQTGKF